MKVSILGNGAIGNLLALNCATNGIEYNLITRDGLPFTLHCTSLNEKQKTLSPEVSNLDSIKHSDIVILPLKAYQIVDAIEQLTHYLTTKQVVVLLHNGMGTLDKVRSLIPKIPLVAATTSVGAYKPSQTSLLVTGEGMTQAGWIKPPHQHQTSCAEHTLNMLLSPLEWHTDVSAILWRKLAINAAINPLTALFDINNGTLLQSRFVKHVEQVCSEVSLVMNTLGYQTNAEELIDSVRHVAVNTASNFSSMNRDMKNLRRTEIDYINGHVVATAQTLGIAVPFNKTLQERVASNQKF